MDICLKTILKQLLKRTYDGDNSTDKFRPDDTLTRYEMAVILQKAFHLPVKQMTFSMMSQIIIGQQTLFVHCIVMALQKEWRL